MKIKISFGEEATIVVRGIESDSQAEIWVRKTSKDPRFKDSADVWTLSDGLGTRAVWFKKEGSKLPALKGWARRFTGNWKKEEGSKWIIPKLYPKPKLEISPEVKFHFGW